MKSVNADSDNFIVRFGIVKNGFSIMSSTIDGKACYIGIQRFAFCISV